jgi:hypothetical protein
VSIISEQPLPSAEPVLSADALLALRKNIGDKLVILDASVPPVVPGYESLKRPFPCRRLADHPRCKALRLRFGLLRSQRGAASYDA